MCKSGRGVAYTKGGGSTIYSFIFERGGGLREVLSKDMGVAYTRGRLTRASTVYLSHAGCYEMMHWIQF